MTEPQQFHHTRGPLFGEPIASDDCASPLHTHPLPSSYTEADDQARRRLRTGWKNKRCDQCGLYGWVAP